jgi:hypothetical protein
MNIFIGTEEIASVITDLAYGFKKLGHQVTTYTQTKNKFYTNSKYDIVRGDIFNNIFNYHNSKILPANIKYYIARIDQAFSAPFIAIRNKKIIKEHDLFIFIWHPWLPESYLFPALKKKGKKIVCIHVGSDVRYTAAFEQEYQIDASGWEAFFQNDSLNYKIKKVRYHELYADQIYSVPDQAGLYLRGYNHFRVPLRNEKNIVFNIPARKVPLIIHAPSRSGIKGTAIINETIEQLKKDGIDLEYKCIQNMPNDELLKLLSDADILCDELNLHGPGMLSAEAMTAGCAVATRCLNIAPFQPPVCSVTPQNLYEKLKLLITDIDYRIKLANAGKKFVEDFNNPVNFAAKILGDLEQDKKCDYDSHFYMEKFRLPADTVLSDTSKHLTKLVVEKYGLQSQVLTNDLKKRGLI